MSKKEVSQKECRIEIRCSQEEADAIRNKAKAAGLTVSDILRSSALNRVIMIRSDIRMRNELKRLGGLQKYLFSQMQQNMTTDLSRQFSNILLSIDDAINAMDLTPVPFNKVQD
ncbi:plasmid mobilization protein MobA [Erwinia billingiae]|uniref:plasmid mobilization protein MobA n=1 Tax=Erwinia billingiae TaxID=182337 RepID=UPI0032092A51